MRLHVVLIVAFVILAPMYGLSSGSALAPGTRGQDSDRGSSEAATVASPEWFSMSCGMPSLNDNGQRG